jgi:hypothetical protein
MCENSRDIFFGVGLARKLPNPHTTAGARTSSLGSFVPIAEQAGDDRNRSPSLTLPVVGAIRPETGQRTS